MTNMMRIILRIFMMIMIKIRIRIMKKTIVGIIMNNCDEN